MVVLFDLDEDNHDDLRYQSDGSAYSFFNHRLRGPLLRAGDDTHDADGVVETPRSPEEAQTPRDNPNLNGFSAALSCYPIVASLASHLDLNTLHDLSRTCRQFRANLLQYRKQLIAQSLRCSKESEESTTKLADRFRESHSAWRTYGTPSYGRRITTGKVGQCARDKVGECRRCGTVVCRNCIAKPPPIPALRDRHRRLCRKCARAPIWLLAAPCVEEESPSYGHSPTSTPSTSPVRAFRFPTPPPDHSKPKAFTAPAFEVTPCNCTEEVWLCQRCGNSNKKADGDYHRAWIWRAKYSMFGGLGAGLGEGNEGVPCGRGAACLAAEPVEQELDYDAELLRHIEEAGEHTGRSWEGGGFEVQEIEGIGGVMKKIVKKLILVGKRVQEFEDERSNMTKYLSREQQGTLRSWCAWCDRPILSDKDKDKSAAAAALD